MWQWSSISQGHLPSGFSLEFRMCVLITRWAGEGLAWCVLFGAIPGEGTATLGAAPPKGYPAQSSQMPPNHGQKFRGEKLMSSHLRQLGRSSQMSVVGPEVWLAWLFSLFSFFAFPVCTYSC